MLTLAQLIPSQGVGPGTQLFYTSPASTKTRIDKMTFCNTTGGAITVTVYLVSGSGTPGSGQIVTSASSVAAGATFNDPDVVGHVLNAGDTIQAFTGGGVMNIMASGVQQT